MELQLIVVDAYRYWDPLLDLRAMQNSGHRDFLA